MNRDLVIHHLVAIDAQLRRMHRLADTIQDGAELKARLPGLLGETAKAMHGLMSRIGQGEGWQPATSGPEKR